MGSLAFRFQAPEDGRSIALTVPGIGPISATAIAVLAPPAETFAKGRDFAAWLGLTPLQRSAGGKWKLALYYIAFHCVRVRNGSSKGQ
jgi:transposase